MLSHPPMLGKAKSQTTERLKELFINHGRGH